MPESPFSLVVGTRGEFEKSGWVRGERLRLNSCCRFQIWLRAGETAVQVTSRCRGCVTALRDLVADPDRARCLVPSSEATGRTVRLVLRAHDSAAPRPLLEEVPSCRYIAR